MPTNINCIFASKENLCNHPGRKRGLFGSRKQCHLLSFAGSCVEQRKHKKPIHQSTSRPPRERQPEQVPDNPTPAPLPGVEPENPWPRQ